MAIDKALIIEIVREAAVLLNHRQAAEHIKVKGVADYVTDVDLKVQQVIEEKLKVYYPDITFMGEEKANKEIDFNGKVWVLDPVDGTTNLIHDYRQSAISLALIEKGKIIFGVVYQPYTDELFYAEERKGAYLNNNPIHVSSVQSMADSLISIGTSPYYAELAEDNFKIFQKVFLDCQDIRRSGSAAIDLAYVACGRIEAFFEKRLHLWDFAAGMLLVKEAGGIVSKLNGDMMEVDVMADIIAGNPDIQPLLINYMR